MGLVASSMTTGAIRLVWFCQLFLDPKYSSIESECTATAEPPPKSQPEPIVISATAASTTASSTSSSSASSSSSFSSSSSSPRTQDEASALRNTSRRSASPEPALLIGASERPLLIAAKSASLPLPSKTKIDLASYAYPHHKESRRRRRAQIRLGSRPSSFDAALGVQGRSKSSGVVGSSPSPLRRRRQMRGWEPSSSSGCSSDSVSNSGSDSETELRVSANVSNDEISAKQHLGVSAEEMTAFRLTVGRGHFSRSKKDRFLNHLRLEKRFNELSNECLTCQH